MANVDLSVFQRQQTLLDHQRLQEEFEQRKRDAQLSELSKVLQLSQPPSFSQAADRAALNLAQGNATDEDRNILSMYSGVHPRSQISGISQPRPSQPQINQPSPQSAPQRLSVENLGIPPMQESALNDTTVNSAMMVPQVTDLGVQDDAQDFKQNPNAFMNGSDQQPLANGDAFLSTLDPKMASVVKLIGDGKIKDTTVLSKMRPETKMEILQNVAQYNPNYNGNQFNANAEFGYKKLGNQVRSFSTAVSHLNTLSELSKALDNGNITAFNALGNEFSKQTGSPAITSFETAKKIVSDEVTKAIIGGATALGDREEQSANIRSMNSPAQLAAYIDTVKELMAGQLNGLQQQYTNSTGGSSADFTNLLAPEARKEVLAKNPVTVATEAEAMKLPVGSKFILNGRTGTVK